VQVVAASMTDTSMNTLDAHFRLLPVGAECLFAAQGLLRFAERACVPPEAVERSVDRAVRKRGEPHHAQVDADRAASRQGPLNLSLGLNTHEPFATGQTDGEALDLPEHGAAVTVAQPAELGQEQATVRWVESDLLRVGITKAIVLSPLLETGEGGPLGEEVSVRALQVPERLL